ncbi:MAG TPA: RraA family protein [Symbiobacteriaceae bacterium]|nr:RraA family protein [Symbiobacteriaceae bacterium]
MYQFLPAAGFSDALAKTQTMDAGMKCITPGKTVIGPAYTVEAYPTGIITCHKALGEVPAGCVLVIDGQGDPNGAMWGELTSMEAMQKGVLGVVVDGAVRDVASVRELGFPVWARHITPRVGSNRTVGTTGGTVVCGGVAVRTGDLIVADDDGVVVVPQERIAEIVAKTEAIEVKEVDMAAKVKAGGHIADMIGMSALIAEADAAAKKAQGGK